MKKLITMIGMGTLLCLVPSCKKSTLMPNDASASNQTNQIEERGLPLNPLPVVNTSMYVMLSSKPCVKPDKQYTSLLVDIKSIEILTDERGWTTVPVIRSGWDLVAMQQSDIPGLNITDRIAVNPGHVSKVIISFGDNSRLSTNNEPVSCFHLGARVVTLDVKGTVLAGAVNELKLAMDMCGNISVEPNPDGTACYILHPVVEFNGIIQKKIK